MRVTVDQFRKEAMKRKRGVRRGASEYPAALREFAVAFVLVTPTGMRVEGLDVETTAELLAKLR